MGKCWGICKLLVTTLFGLHSHYLFPEITTDAVFESENSTYQVIKAKTRWDHAGAYCHTIGGHLAAFETAEEFSSISSYVTDAAHHFGLNVLEQNRKFIWEHTGQEVGTYRPWGLNEPTLGSHELCGFFRRGKWYDAKCTYKFSFICEFAKQ